MEIAYRFTYFNLDDNRKKCFLKHFKSEAAKKTYLESVLKKNITNLKITKMYDPPANSDKDLEREIVAKKRLVVKDTSHIYALIDEDRVVYIGMSSNIMDRLGTHMKSQKIFTHYAIVETSDSLEYIKKREAEYIEALKPKYNKASLNGAAKKPKGLTGKTRSKDYWF